VIKGFAECLIAPNGDKEVAVSHHAHGGGEDIDSAASKVPTNNQLVQHILDSCTHIQRILDNSLDLGKLEQHKLVLEDEVVDMKATADQVSSMMSKRLKPGVRFLVGCADVSFRGDATRWMQLLLNLVTNAVKFTSSGIVRLDISAEEILPGDRRWSKTTQHVVHVRVRDTGCGISKEGQAVLFQKYQQVHGRQGPAKVIEDSGTGLGLVISQHIVHLMGCASGISVQSPCKCPEDGTDKATQRGAGTMFSFSVMPKDLSYNPPPGELDARASPTPGSSLGVSPIPCTMVQSARLTSTPIPPIDQRHVKANIMVVDDELLNRMVLLAKLRQCEEQVRERLGAAGRGLDACHFSMDVEQAEHAEMGLVVMHDKIEARQKQEANGLVQVDIIILDEHMESSGGILKGTEAMTHFRQLAQKHGEKQPVIVLSSGNCSAGDQQRYTDMGADVTWRKPYPTGDLVVESLVEWVLQDLVQDCKAPLAQAGGEVALL
jgi:CheY-like chemotaxis protein